MPCLMRSLLRFNGAIRSYATRPRSRLGPHVSLDHVSILGCLAFEVEVICKELTHVQFLQRSRALALWRDILRSTRRIKGDGDRMEMRQLARDEFERNRNVTDLVCLMNDM